MKGKTVVLEEDGDDVKYRVGEEITKNLYGVVRPGSFESFLNYGTTHSVLTTYRTLAKKSYDKDEFAEHVPDALKPFVDRSGALDVGNEVNYHEARMEYINYVHDKISKSPRELIGLEKVVSKIFFKGIVFGDQTDSRKMSNAALQFKQLELSALNVYALLCLRNCGKDNYILGVNDDESFVLRGYKHKKDFFGRSQTFDRIHSHALTFLTMDPSAVSALVDRNAEWAYDPSRFAGVFDEGSGAVGFKILKSGQDNKRFHSSLPHEIHLDSSLKHMTVLDSPPNEIYFMPKFRDGTISIGRMAVCDDDLSQVSVDSSDLASRFLLDNTINVKESAALYDIAGSVARDMFVLEHRGKQYNPGSNGGGKKRGGRRSKNKKVVWLPRFKVDLTSRKNEDLIREEIIRLSPCHVSGHIRKVDNPSSRQLMLATSLGIEVPEGYTYVGEHDRGESEEFKRVYKSRSALNVLYGMK